MGKNDPQFTFIMVSDQLAKILGYENAEEMMEVSGGCMAGICNLEDTMRELPQAQAAVDAGKMYTMRYRVRCKDGSWKNIEDRGRLITNENGEEEYWSFIVDQDKIVKTTEALEEAKKANKKLNEARNELKIARDKADAANEAKTQILFNILDAARDIYQFFKGEAEKKNIEFSYYADIAHKHIMCDKRYYEKTEVVSHNSDSKDKIKGKHILLAEDNDLNAEIASIVLSDVGLIVDRVEDGVQCVAKIENYPIGTYDLILMDIQMPNMDGYKATQVIRRLSDKEKANIPIVAMTANAFEEDKQDAFKAGMNGHIAKPIDIKNLEDVLISIL